MRDGPISPSSATDARTRSRSSCAISLLRLAASAVVGHHEHSNASAAGMKGRLRVRTSSGMLQAAWTRVTTSSLQGVPRPHRSRRAVVNKIEVHRRETVVAAYGQGVAGSECSFQLLLSSFLIVFNVLRFHFSPTHRSRIQPNPAMLPLPPDREHRHPGSDFIQFGESDGRVHPTEHTVRRIRGWRPLDEKNRRDPPENIRHRLPSMSMARLVNVRGVDAAATSRA